MSRATIACQKLADLPGYVIPCPNCSFLDVLDFDDAIRSPMISRSRHTGAFGLWGSCSCLCSAMIRGETESAVAQEWQKCVAKAVIKKGGRIASTLSRLQRRGLIPSAFPVLICRLHGLPVKS